MKLPNKSKLYQHKKDFSIWEVWEGDDFSDNYVLMYEKETGEDAKFTLENFWKTFEEVVE